MEHQSSQSLSPARPGRRTVALTAAAVALAVALAAGGYLLGTRGSPATAPPQVTPAASSPAPSPVPRPQVTWQTVGGVLLPFSSLHGPRTTTDNQAAGYSHTEAGAALCAVQVLLRTSATSGPTVFEPVLAAQVTGANAPAMQLLVRRQYDQLAAQYDVTGGGPLPIADSHVVGYQVTAYDDQQGTASVDVVVDSPALAAKGQVVSFPVQLQWTYDDWRVIAPPQGDWGQVATTLDAKPAELSSYDDIT